MPRTIPATLLTTLGAGVVRVSRLMKIGPLTDGSYLTWTNIDKDEVYDDGEGERTYRASTGLQMTTVQATNDLSVDNAEAQSLVPVYPDVDGITEEMVNRGLLDTAPYVVYEHKVIGGTVGSHWIVASGVLGQVRMEQGLVAIPELRSWTQLLGQTGIISETSIDCRVKHFGSQIGEEREWCGYDLTGEWVSFTVSGVGTEVVREFYTSDLGQADDYFAPGLVTWQTGDNAGASVEVESYFGADTGSDAYISLRFTTREPIQIGDTGEIRRDCTRKWVDHNSCETYFGVDKGAHFRGEPLINIGDTAANGIPGVNTTVSTGGTGE